MTETELDDITYQIIDEIIQLCRRHGVNEAVFFFGKRETLEDDKCLTKMADVHYLEKKGIRESPLQPIHDWGHQYLKLFTKNEMQEP